MKRKRKSQFTTEAEYLRWMARFDENTRELRRLIDRAKAELAAKRQPES
jgi:hypothetical protein